MVHKIVFLAFGILAMTSFAAAQTQDVPPLPAKVTPEQEQEALQFAQEFDPPLAEHLSELKIERPDRYKREIGRLLKEKMRLERLQRKDPERYEQVFKIHSMEAKSKALGRRYREADEAEKAKIKTQLQSLLGELFDLRNLDREEEVSRLEKRLDELRRSLAMREKNKEQIIERRLLQLTGEKSYLEW